MESSSHRTLLGTKLSEHRLSHRRLVLCARAARLGALRWCETQAKEPTWARSTWAARRGACGCLPISRGTGVAPRQSDRFGLRAAAKRKNDRERGQRFSRLPRRAVRRGLDRARRKVSAGGTSGPCLAFSRVLAAAEGAGPILCWASCDKDGISPPPPPPPRRRRRGAAPGPPRNASASPSRALSQARSSTWNASWAGRC